MRTTMKAMLHGVNVMMLGWKGPYAQRLALGMIPLESGSSSTNVGATSFSNSSSSIALRTASLFHPSHSVSFHIRVPCDPAVADEQCQQSDCETALAIRTMIFGT